MNSQNTLKLEPRVQVTINSNGDTLLTVKLGDSRLILNDILEKQVVDSLLTVYKQRDDINSSTIILQKAEINTLNDKIGNLQTISMDNWMVISNKDKEIIDLHDVITQQKKEIRKQKILKIIGFTGSVVLPIAVLILLTL